MKLMLPFSALKEAGKHGKHILLLQNTAYTDILHAVSCNAANSYSNTNSNSSTAKNSMVLISTTIQDVELNQIDLPAVVIHLHADGHMKSVMSTMECELIVVIYESEDFSNSLILHQKLHTQSGSSDPLLSTAVSISKKDVNSCSFNTTTCPSIFIKVLHWVFWKISPPELLESKSHTVYELSQRYRDLDLLLNPPKDTVCSCSQSLRCWSYVCQQVVNLFIGVVLLMLLVFYGSILSRWVLSHTGAMIRMMVNLLEWLMGVPAGLKLNYRLTVFLGKFFTYHVWLWAGYLQLVGDHFLFIIKMIGAVGLLGGASLQLALLQDLINLLTLHLFCFYIYSARLYSVVIYSILALWRLFRGLKWNNLRQRVDHASYDITQLFIGTLLFSILLFVLPTILLYYAVFAVFRLVVIAVQRLLQCLRLSLLQDYILLRLMLLWKSKYLKDEYQLTISPVSNGTSTVVLLGNFAEASYSKTISLLKLPQVEKELKLSELISALMRGEIM